MHKNNFNMEFDYKPKQGNVDPIHIYMGGGLGDAAMAINFLHSFREFVGKQYDYIIYAKEPEIYKFYLPWIKKTYTDWEYGQAKLDFSVEVCDALVFRISKQEVFLPTPLVRLVDNWHKSLDKWSFEVFHLPHCATMFTKKLESEGFNRHNFVYHQIGLPLVEAPIALLPSPYALHQKTLIVNDGFSVVHHPTLHTATKNWTLEYWSDLLDMIGANYPDLLIVQVGAPGAIPLRGTDLCLCGKTGISQLIRYVSNADFYIGNDSGPVHIRHLYKKRSMVLWGPTPASYLEYADNINISGSVCQPCLWQSTAWNERCRLLQSDDPKNHLCAKMLSITPIDVFTKFKEWYEREDNRIKSNEI